MASVVKCFEVGPPNVVHIGPGPGFAAPRWFWEAFIARDGRFEHVLVDGRPGRWKKRAEAMAAAESAYGPDLTRHTIRRPTRRQPDDREVGHFRSLWRAWRTVYRSDPEKPVSPR